MTFCHLLGTYPQFYSHYWTRYSRFQYSRTYVGTYLPRITRSACILKRYCKYFDNSNRCCILLRHNTLYACILFRNKNSFKKLIKKFLRIISQPPAFASLSLLVCVCEREIREILAAIAKLLKSQLKNEQISQKFCFAFRF